MLRNKQRKVALVGAGAVGTSFLYSAMNRNIADVYGIIDVNVSGAKGNKLDLEDASATNDFAWRTQVIDYPHLKDYDVLVITAGRPQKPGESRLEMIADNAKIMKDIALKVKKSGFKGLTVVASNPVDVLATVYQKVTGFAPSHVLGSGTSLDTSRLRVALSDRLNISPLAIQAYVIGEHGDSSASVFSSATVGGKKLSHFLAKNKVTKEDLAKIHKKVYLKAYEIIDLKRATFYGIGSALAQIVGALFSDTKEIYACGAKLAGEYGYEGFYTGVPAVIGAGGIEQIIELDLDKEEKNQFAISAKTLQETLKEAFKAIN